MASPRFVKMTPIICGDYGKQGGSLKEIVQFILDNDPGLELYSVKTDTEAKYAVYLRVKDTNALIYIYNNYARVHVYCCMLKSDGSIYEYTGTGYDYVLSENREVFAAVYGIGDAVGGFTIINSYSSYNGIFGGYTRFTCDNYDGMFGTVCSSGAQNTYPHIYANSPFTGYVIDHINDKITGINFNMNLDTSIAKAAKSNSGKPYFYELKCNEAYSDSLGFLNIKFAGLYSFYFLNNNSANLSFEPGTEVVVNAVSVIATPYIIKAL